MKTMEILKTRHELAEDIFIHHEGFTPMNCYDAADNFIKERENQIELDHKKSLALSTEANNQKGNW